VGYLGVCGGLIVAVCKVHWGGMQCGCQCCWLACGIYMGYLHHFWLGICTGTGAGLAGYGLQGAGWLPWGAEVVPAPCWCGGSSWWRFEACRGVAIFDFVEGDDGWEYVLEWAGETVTKVELVEPKAPFKVVPGCHGDGPQDMGKPIWVVCSEGSKLPF